MHPRREPEDGTGQEFPAIAPSEGTNIVRRPKGGSDPQKRAGGKGVKIMANNTRPEKAAKGVNIISRDSK